MNNAVVLLTSSRPKVYLTI